MRPLHVLGMPLPLMATGSASAAAGIGPLVVRQKVATAIARTRSFFTPFTALSCPWNSIRCGGPVPPNSLL